MTQETFSTAKAALIARSRARWAATFFLLVPLMFFTAARGEVRLHPLFTDNMVLQQQMPVKIWGWGDDGAHIVVELQGEKVETDVKGGRWSVTLSPLQPGGPFELTVKGSGFTIVLTNILVGEVWICSGQSNMEWPLWNTAEGSETLKSATNQWLRFYKVARARSATQLDTLTGRWEPCTPASARDFSAVAYHFGEALQKAKGVPVGLIQSAWGGSPIEVWMPREVLLQDPDYRRYVLDTYRGAWVKYKAAYERWQQAAAQARKEGTKVPPEPGRPWQPSELFNAMIAPLIPMSFRGVIWYQGESNAGFAWLYRRLFPDMIDAWRRAWGIGEFPFLAVQLAPWDKGRNRPIEEILFQPTDSDWAELREAQLLASRILPNVGLVVTTDIGDKDDIHPRRKRPVGERLALAARVIAYGENIDGLSPTLRKAEVREGKVWIEFDHLNGHLRTAGLVEVPMGFAIAGPDRKWRWANAQLHGDQVVVWHPNVPQPVAVRFGWADFPVVNLFSPAGLPVSPFRTDNWPMITAPKN